MVEHAIHAGHTGHWWKRIVIGERGETRQMNERHAMHTSMTLIPVTLTLTIYLTRVRVRVKIRVRLGLGLGL
jgi:hypothetical protein